MIRNTILFSLPLVFIAACNSNSNLDAVRAFDQASFEVNEVYVNINDGIENSNRIRNLMQKAGTNTAKLYNAKTKGLDGSYPLEIEINNVNFRKPDASIASGERTYIEYTAILRKEETGEVYRSLPVTYYHVTPNKVTTDAAKSHAEKNMIRLSIKDTFAKLYGMEDVPQTVQAHFNTQNIFLSEDVIIERTFGLDELPIASISKPEPKQASVSDALISEASLQH